MGNLDNNASTPAPEEQRTDCLSSNATLFWRVFVPIFGTVFLSGMTTALLLLDEDNLYLPFPALWARISALVFLVAWVLLVRRTIWRLKRVDANDTHLFVTNFWQTVRYPWSDVLNITESKRFGRKLVHFHLIAPGRFGKVISILPASNFEALVENFKVRLV